MDTLIFAIIKQLTTLFVVSLLFSKILSWLSDKNNELLFSTSPRAYALSSYIGVPVHEIGHLIMCLLFFHKVSDVKLISFSLRSREMGYVEHTYNHKNIYQQIGNYFIAIGPIISGIIVILLLHHWMTPETINIYLDDIQSISKDYFNIFNIDILNRVFDLYKSYIVNFYNEFNIGMIKTWLLLVGIIFISLNMSLSGPDLEHAKAGILYSVIVLVIINTISFYLRYSLFVRVDYYISNISLVFNIILPIIIIINIVFLIFIIFTRLIKDMILKIKNRIQ